MFNPPKTIFLVLRFRGDRLGPRLREDDAGLEESLGHNNDWTSNPDVEISQDASILSLGSHNIIQFFIEY